MAATITDLEARPISAGSHELVRLMLATHAEHERGKKAAAEGWNWAARDALAQADAHLTELAALLLPAVVAYEDERDRADMKEHDAWLRSFPDDDPPF